MHQRPFKQIDVFSDRPGYGNPWPWCWMPTA